MSKTRTFVAVAASDETRRQATQLIDRLCGQGLDIRWTAPANLHWTIQFLGDVEDQRLAAVCDAVTAATGELETFGLVAHGVGAFPSIERPRTLWLGASQGSDEMVALQSAVEEALARLGFRGENRQFVPHLTLGRAGKGRNPAALSDTLRLFSEFEAGSGVVQEAVVYGSELDRSGPTYHVIGRAPLA